MRAFLIKRVYLLSGNIGVRSTRISFQDYWADSIVATSDNVHGIWAKAIKRNAKLKIYFTLKKQFGKGDFDHWAGGCDSVSAIQYPVFLVTATDGVEYL